MHATDSVGVARSAFCRIGLPAVHCRRVRRHVRWSCPSSHATAASGPRLAVVAAVTSGRRRQHRRQLQRHLGHPGRGWQQGGTAGYGDGRCGDAAAGLAPPPPYRAQNRKQKHVWFCFSRVTWGPVFLFEETYFSVQESQRPPLTGSQGPYDARSLHISVRENSHSVSFALGACLQS